MPTQRREIMNRTYIHLVLMMSDARDDLSDLMENLEVSLIFFLEYFVNKWK